MDLLILSMVFSSIAVSIAFRKQLCAGIIKIKRHIDERTETSIKIEQTIKKLGKKRKLAKLKFKQIHQSLESLRIQSKRELETAIEIGKVEVIAKKDEDEFSKGDAFDVKSISAKDPRFIDIGRRHNWNRKIFEVVPSCKNTIRYNSIEKMEGFYQNKANRVEEFIKAIDSAVKSLENEKQYVLTMEGLLELEGFDTSINITDIMSEITALEAQISLEERLNNFKYEQVDV